MSVGNAQALADLQASVDALVAASDNVPPDISDSVESAVTTIDGVTTALGGTPPSSGSSTTTPAADTPTEDVVKDDPGSAPSTPTPAS
jgi:hypothetical protein